MDLPQELYDMIVLHVVENCDDHDSREVNPSATPPAGEAKEQLSILRLVNKGFCRSASVRLFRTIHVNAPARPSQQGSEHLALKLLYAISLSEYSQDVRKVVVNIRPNSSTKGCDLLSSTFRRFIEGVIRILPICLYNFHRLSSLHIFGHSLFCSWMTKFGYLKDLYFRFRATIAKTFRYVPFLSLEELVLHLPDAEDFAALLIEKRSSPSSSSIKSAMKNVKHLDFAICKLPGGNHSVDSSLPFTTEDSPNINPEMKVFEIVRFVPNLHVLKLYGYPLLDMNVDLTNLESLQTLELTSIVISGSHFMSLIRRNCASLRTVSLNSTQLKSNTWADVFLALCSVPRLELLKVRHARYCSTGESAVWAPFIFKRDLEPETVVSNHHPDRFALGNVLRHVNANRDDRQLPKLGGSLYRLAILEPLEKACPDFIAQRAQEG